MNRIVPRMDEIRPSVALSLRESGTWLALVLSSALT